jgi:tetratricopeptide (TPR) repeat protein
MRVLLATILCVPMVCVPLGLQADESHSHGDHASHDLGNIGTTHFATSCNEAAQREIDRGVALIHSFWYVEAEQSFRRAAGADTGCGIAWWGVAMSSLHPLWAPPTPAELRTGGEGATKAQQVGASTARERSFIDAINTFYKDADKVTHAVRMAAYEKAMAGVAAANPQDDEAAIFHALALLGTASPNDKTYAKQKEAAQILNRILPRRPEHPGIAHYLIHSFDYPELAELALPAARSYAKLAPGSPHALHMPSHIFTRLGLWDESIASNLASADKARSYTDRVMPGAVAFDELHAIDYLVYAYLQQGQLEKAQALVERTAAVKKLDNGNHFAGAYAIGAVPARFALERQDWRGATTLVVPTVVDWQKVPYAEANIHFARAVGASRAGELAIAREAIARLEAIRQVLLDQNNAYWADQVEIQRRAAAAWLAQANKDSTAALQMMRSAADLEATTEKHPVTPGAILPAREQLAEMLIDAGHTDEALAEIQKVLRDAPHRRNAERLSARARATTASNARVP